MKVPLPGVPPPGMRLAAASSSVKFPMPLAPDTRINLCPFGPVRSMLTFVGEKWLNPAIVTVTFVTGSVTLATVMLDG